MSESKRKQETYPVTRKFGLLAGICTAPLFIIFAYFGDTGRGSTAWFSAIVILVVIRTFWGLKKRLWFWITITIIGLLHVFLILFVSWPFKQVSQVALLPVGLLDVVIAYGIIRLVEIVIEVDPQERPLEKRENGDSEQLIRNCSLSPFSPRTLTFTPDITQSRIGEYLGPFGEWEIGGDQNGGPLGAISDDQYVPGNINTSGDSEMPLGQQYLQDLIAPPIIAAVWWALSRGWATAVQRGQVTDRTRRRQKSGFFIVLAILYVAMFGTTTYLYFSQ